MNEYITVEDAARAFGVQTLRSFRLCEDMLRRAINRGDIQSVSNVKPVVEGKWVDGEVGCPVCGESKFKDMEHPPSPAGWKVWGLRALGRLGSMWKAGKRMGRAENERKRFLQSV